MRSRKAGLPCNTSSEAGALDTGVFLKTTFFHDLCHPDHYEPKIFFRFSKSGSTLRYTISDSRVPSCNAISEGRPPLQHELGSGSSRYRKDVSRMTRTKNFLRQNFFKIFLKTILFHDLCHPDHYEPKIFFRFLKSGPEGFPIMSSMSANGPKNTSVVS